MLKNLQYGLGFLIGCFATLTLAIGVVAGIEAMTGKAIPFKIVIVPLAAIGIGILVARWIGSLDLARYFTAKEPEPKEPKEPKAPPPPRPAPQPKRKEPWTFYLVGTLISFWGISLAGIIILFGPFGFADDPSISIRLFKIAACTVAIIGLGGFLLLKEFAKLMSRQTR